MKDIFWHIVALVVIAIWGVTFISTKVLISAGLLPSQIFAIRFIIAYAGICALCLRGGHSRRLFSDSLRDEGIFIILGVTGGSLYFLAENTALTCTQACNVSFIVCSAPLITTLLTLLVKNCFKGELVDSLEDVQGRWTLLLGSILALAGMAAVFFDGNAVEFSAAGDLLALGAALCWGVYSIFMSRMVLKYGSLYATRKVFFYGLVTVIPFLVGAELDYSLLLRSEVWGNLLFLSVVASLACFILWNKVISRIGNVTSTNYIYLNPLFTLVAAVVVLGERLTLQSALGCIAILAGVIVAEGF